MWNVARIRGKAVAAIWLMVALATVGAGVGGGDQVAVVEARHGGRVGGFIVILGVVVHAGPLTPIR